MIWISDEGSWREVAVLRPESDAPAPREELLALPAVEAEATAVVVLPVLTVAGLALVPISSLIWMIRPETGLRLAAEAFADEPDVVDAVLLLLPLLA